jgi:hypothetical protein
MYDNLQDAIDDGYHYFLRSIYGDYTNSMWAKKETAMAALEMINRSLLRNVLTPLIIIADKDL